MDSRISFLQKCTPQIEKYANCVFNKSNAQSLWPPENFTITEHGYISFICFINRRLGPKNASRGYWNTIRAVFFRKLVVGRSSLKIFMRYWHHVPYQCVLTFIANFCIFYMRIKPKGVSSTMFFTSNDKNIYLRMWIFFDI